MSSRKLLGCLGFILRILALQRISLETLITSTTIGAEKELRIVDVGNGPKNDRIHGIALD
jgi:hypothetical protein